MRFILRGHTLDFERAPLERALRGVEPEPVTTHAVEVNGKLYPVKQALRIALKATPEVSGQLAGIDFTSADARSILRRLDFRLFEERPTKPTPRPSKRKRS